MSYRTIIVTTLCHTHALPLPGGRFSCPRIGRGQSRGLLRDTYRSWPLTSHSRELELSADRKRKRIIPIHKQSVCAFNPRKQARLRTVRVLGDAAALTVHEPAATTTANCLQEVRSREQSMSPNCSRRQSVRELRLAKNHLRRCISVSISSPVSFPVCIQTIPIHDII
jgi:hypothetical protein